jgi:hypothetical protein
VRHEAFYATCAQVLPLLFVAVVLEARMFRGVSDLPGAAYLTPVFRLFFIALVVLAEYICIQSLATLSDSGIRRALVGYAMFYAGARSRSRLLTLNLNSSVAASLRACVR